jgi:predicted dehydrogenase
MPSNQLCEDIKLIAKVGKGLNILTKKLAFIGSGNIADFHVPALRAAGLEISHCASSPNSKTIAEFAARHEIDRVWQDPKELIYAHNQWDGIVITAAIEPTLDLLTLAMRSGKPILVEKPVSISAALLSKYANTAPKNVIVAFNRRHYNTVQKAREFVAARSVVRASMTLPDKVLGSGQFPYYNVHENSVHGFDMLAFIFGPLTIEKIVAANPNDPFFGRQALLRTKNRNLISLSMNWCAPSNFGLSIDDANTRIDLFPFEKLQQYQGMDVIDPSDEYPARQYVPKLVSSSSVFDGASTSLKPGFGRQSEEFSKLLAGEPAAIGGNLTDAYNAQVLADAIVNLTN